jgi:hypothetical protein
MFTHPAITAALADQHRRDLTAQASACRLARAARDSRRGRSPQPRRRTGLLKTIRRAATAAAAAAAAAVLMMTPAGAATTHHFNSPHVSAHHISMPSRSFRWAS